MNRKEAIFALFYALLIAILGSALASPAHASFAEPVPADTYQGARVDRHATRTLVRMCAGETGVRRQGWVEACVVQVGIIARRAAASGRTLSEQAMLYSSALKRARPDRVWVTLLEENGRRPEGFPSGASWSEYRSRLAVLFWIVRSQLAGDVPDTCAGADHFGSVRMDGHRARRANWTRVCSFVHRRQGFWSL